MIFGSDNMVGASRPVLDAIVAANDGAQPSYGADAWCEAARQQLCRVFERPVHAYFTSTGTVANSLALSALAPPWGSILCQSDAHVLKDESTAPEFFTGGARLVPLEPVAGKLTPDVVAAALDTGASPPHDAAAGALTVTQCNERGLIYTPAEVAALTQVAKANRLKIHMDGARFANALVALDCSPADLTWRAGVDVLTLGASKNGALIAEAVVFFDEDLAADFPHRVKRAGQMAAKSRFFGAQFKAWLENDHWLELARQANATAAYLGERIETLPGVRRAWPVQANEVFAVMPRKTIDWIREQGGVFYDWPAHALPSGERLQPSEALVRFVTSFASTMKQVDALLGAARSAR